MPDKILVVDDEPNILYVIERCFASPKMKVISVSNARAALQAFQAERPDVALLDIRLPDKSGLDLFQELRAADARVPVILMTAYAKSDTAIEAMSRGAFDYLLKPLDLETLKRLVEKAVETSRLQRVAALIDDGETVPDKSEQIIGRSPSMQEVYKQIGRVAPHNYPVLIIGESGTGKELIARAIYQHSTRRDRPFLAINCAALPETLLESELFGHEKGAFTGAEQRRIGKFEQVNGGTIFLDEIGDMSLATQAKALRLLQQQQFERLGGNAPVTTDVRVIAATNKNLDEAVKAGTFRLDLYYRLNGFKIELPPLRERRDDIPRLVEYFLKQLCTEQGRPPCAINESASEILKRHDWPGNIRELRSALSFAALHAPGNMIDVDDLPETCRMGTATTLGSPSDFAALTRQYVSKGMTDIYRRLLAEFDAQVLKAAWDELAGNQAKMAEQLGLARMTLRGKLREAGLIPSEPDNRN